MKRLLAYLLLSSAILLLFVLIVGGFDRTVVDRLETEFNAQQAIQTQLSAQGISEHIHWRLEEISDLVTRTITLDATPFNQKNLDTGRQEFLALGLLADGAFSQIWSATDTPYTDTATQQLETWLRDYSAAVLDSNQPFFPPLVATPTYQFYGILYPVHASEAGFTGVLGAILDFSVILEAHIIPVHSGQYGAAWIQ
ncbi:MAG: hypothetical protein K8I60_09525, partial [Anaerolineae bacterium]|nr:hypothetical protein [Anaerolineae bacterium]